MKPVVVLAVVTVIAVALFLYTVPPGSIPDFF
jgi:hypothetical protein